MTWHIKPKKPIQEQGPPQPCFRCGRQMGDAQLTIVDTSAASASSENALWLCAECRAEIARDGGAAN